LQNQFILLFIFHKFPLFEDTDQRRISPEPHASQVGTLS
jgi:hypothetical protein